jgi:hypothetical protein
MGGVATLADPEGGVLGFGTHPPPFDRNFCENGVEITHFETGTLLSKPNIIVETRPLKTNLNGGTSPL